MVMSFYTFWDYVSSKFFLDFKKLKHYVNSQIKWKKKQLPILIFCNILILNTLYIRMYKNNVKDLLFFYTWLVCLYACMFVWWYVCSLYLLQTYKYIVSTNSNRFKMFVSCFIFWLSATKQKLQWILSLRSAVFGLFNVYIASLIFCHVNWRSLVLVLNLRKKYEYI